MARRQPAPPTHIEMTPNQIVAFNLARAREWRGWTQDQASEAIAPHLGQRWSRASFSFAERSVDGKQVRQFSADEIVALARGFGLPVTWFFMPPPGRVGGLPVRLRTPDSGAHGEKPSMLLDLIFGDEDQQMLLELRLNELAERMDPGELTEAQLQVRTSARNRVDALVRSAIGDLDRWHTTLHAIANQIEDLDVRAKAAVIEPKEEP